MIMLTVDTWATQMASYRNHIGQHRIWLQLLYVMNFYKYKQIKKTISKPDPEINQQRALRQDSYRYFSNSVYGVLGSAAPPIHHVKYKKG